MAKRRPTLSLERMESDLGYKVDALNHSGSSMVHFYTDFRPIVHSIYERTLREFEELEKQKACRDAIICGIVLPELGVPKVRHPSAQFRHINILTDHRTWRRHSDNITYELCWPLQLHWERSIRLWARSSAATYQE